MITLSAEERERFAAWLEQDAKGTLGLVEQMNKIASMQVVAGMRKAEADAELLIARMLRVMSSETI